MEAYADRLVGGMLGLGQQHKAFHYSREGLTPNEKAAERSQHYRRLKQVERGDPVVSHRQMVMPERLYELSKQDEINKDQRGLKEVSAKDEETRRVGSKMKKEFLSARGLDADSKEGRNALNKAKRDYKAGTMPWASLYTKGEGAVVSRAYDRVRAEDVIGMLGGLAASGMVDMLIKGKEGSEIISGLAGLYGAAAVREAVIRLRQQYTLADTTRIQRKAQEAMRVAATVPLRRNEVAINVPGAVARGK